MDFLVTCVDNETVILNWVTASEENSAYFQVEKSEDGVFWTKSGNVPAAGNSQNLLNYYFEDRLNNEFTYYRLTQADINGDINVFEPVVVNCDLTENDFMTYPNPSSSDFYVFYKTKPLDDLLFISVANTQGSILYSSEFSSKQSTIIPIQELNLSAGTYFVNIRSSSGLNRMVRHQIL
jgi:hypothetical protein